MRIKPYIQKMIESEHQAKDHYTKNILYVQAMQFIALDNYTAQHKQQTFLFPEKSNITQLEMKL